jgi:predicted XRE-type DNA-binding protein
MPRGRTRVSRSSGNVFRDLGFSASEAEHLRVRAELMIKIERVLKARKLKQAEAAKLMGVSQPRVSDLLRGKIDLFSSDSLIDMLARLGLRVSLVASAAGSRRVA